MVLTSEQLSKMYKEEKKKERRVFLWATLILFLIFLLSLCFRTAEPGFIPKDMIHTFLVVIKNEVRKLLDLPGMICDESIIRKNAYYFELLSRLKNSLITVFAGMAVALSGAVFQTTFKNPLASPNMLGATSGVSLGNLILFMQYGAFSQSLHLTRYVYCYSFSIGILIVVFFFSKFVAKDGKFSVIDMVLAGSIISQLINVFIIYCQFNMDEDILLLYQRVAMGTYVAVDNLSLVLFLSVTGISMLPILLMRYGINILSFGDEEAKMTGLRPGVIRFFAMAGASILVTCAVIHCGSMGVIAMVIPHLCRYIVGADFKKLAVMSMFFGGGIMLFCRMASSVIYLNGEPLPINFIISVVATPAFIIIVMKQRRGFE